MADRPLSPSSAAARAEHRPAWRRVLIPALIALTSVLGAIGAWRASAASGAAAGAERKAFSDSVAAEQMRTIIESGLGRVELSYARRLALLVSAGILRDEAAAAPDEAARLLALADSQEAAAASFWVDAGALRPDGSLDLDSKRQADWIAAAYAQDLDPAPEMARAADLRSKSQRLVGLTACFIAAALFLTLAELSRRPRVEILYWYGGVVVLLASTTLLVLVEAL